MSWEIWAHVLQFFCFLSTDYFCFICYKGVGALPQDPLRLRVSIGKLHEGECQCREGKQRVVSRHGPGLETHHPTPAETVHGKLWTVGNPRSVTKAQETREMSIETCFHKLLEQNKILKKLSPPSYNNKREGMILF